MIKDQHTHTHIYATKKIIAKVIKHYAFFLLMFFFVTALLILQLKRSLRLINYSSYNLITSLVTQPKSNEFFNASASVVFFS